MQRFKARMILLAVMTLVLAGSQASAQPKPLLPSSRLTLDDLVVATIVQGDQEQGHGDTKKPQVQATVDAYKIERTTMLELESRIRLDTVDGKTLLLKFNGPQREELKNVVTAIVPVGPKQVRFPVEDTRFFRLNGDKITAADAINILATERPIFLIDDAGGDPPKVPELYRQVLSPECLILMTQRKVREIEQSGEVNSGAGQAAPKPLDPKQIKAVD